MACGAPNPLKAVKGGRFVRQLVHGEEPSELALLGGGIIIIATAVYTVKSPP